MKKPTSPCTYSGYNPATTRAVNNRETWLQEAVKLLRPMLEEHEARVPPDLHVSVGWAKGGKGDVIGQCWQQARETKDGKVTHVFVCPSLGEDPAFLLATLLHELVHAAVGNEHGHRGPFRRVYRALGYEGRVTIVNPGEELKGRLAKLAAQLGDYPHEPLKRPARRSWKRGETKELRVYSRNYPKYRVYVQRALIEEYGLPLDPDGEEMVPKDEL